MAEQCTYSMTNQHNIETSQHQNSLTRWLLL